MPSRYGDEFFGGKVMFHVFSQSVNVCKIIFINERFFFRNGIVFIFVHLKSN